MDIRLSPEMKSLAEAIRYDDDMMRAFTRLCEAAGMKCRITGTVFTSINDLS